MHPNIRKFTNRKVYAQAKPLFKFTGTYVEWLVWIFFELSKDLIVLQIIEADHLWGIALRTQ